MIYVNDPMFKVSYELNTDDQSAAEDFILLLGRNYHGDKKSMFLCENAMPRTSTVNVIVHRAKRTKRLKFTIRSVHA